MVKVIWKVFLLLDLLYDLALKSILKAGWSQVWISEVLGVGHMPPRLLFFALGCNFARCKFSLKLYDILDEIIVNPDEVL